MLENIFQNTKFSVWNEHYSFLGVYSFPIVLLTHAGMPFFPADPLLLLQGPDKIQPRPQSLPWTRAVFSSFHIPTALPLTCLEHLGHSTTYLALHGKAEDPSGPKVLAISAFPKMLNTISHISHCRYSLNICLA